MTPTFQGEVQFRRYSDTSTQGQQLVFAVQGREELESFIGKEGKRFMAVLVEIGDDERPVEQPKPREHLGDLCYRAVMWCNDPAFRDWMATHYEMPIRPTAEDAANVIRVWCGIESRKELDTNNQAGEKFKRVFVGPWQKYQMSGRAR